MVLLLGVRVIELAWNASQMQTKKKKHKGEGKEEKNRARSKQEAQHLRKTPQVLPPGTQVSLSSVWANTDS